MGNEHARRIEDEARFTAFFNEYHRDLTYYLIRLCGDADIAADLCQEAFSRYYQHAAEKGFHKALLYRIAYNAFVDHYRHARRSSELHDSMPDTRSSTETTVIVRQEYDRVLRAMEQLSENERDVLSLAISSDLNYREIGEITGMSETNVKVTVHRARRKLRGVLAGGDK